jgi:maltooligosyltrehalose trehalohydrolase
VREGRRSEFAAFGWDPKVIPDPQESNTFARSKLDWGELEKKAHADLLDWHRRLIRLRKEIPAFTDGRLDVVQTRHDQSDRWLVVERGPVTVACNFSSVPAAVDISPGEILLTSNEPSGLTLPPASVTIWRTG